MGAAHGRKPDADRAAAFRRGGDDAARIGAAGLADCTSGSAGRWFDVASAGRFLPVFILYQLFRRKHFCSAGQSWYSMGNGEKKVIFLCRPRVCISSCTLALALFGLPLSAQNDLIQKSIRP